MADVGILRKRVKSVMEQVRRDQAERRGRVADATKIYTDFLTQAAVPALVLVLVSGIVVGVILKQEQQEDVYE